MNYLMKVLASTDVRSFASHMQCSPETVGFSRVNTLFASSKEYMKYLSGMTIGMHRIIGYRQSGITLALELKALQYITYNAGDCVYISNQWATTIDVYEKVKILIARSPFSHLYHAANKTIEYIPTGGKLYFKPITSTLRGVVADMYIWDNAYIIPETPCNDTIIDNISTIKSIHTFAKNCCIIIAGSLMPDVSSAESLYVDSELIVNCRYDRELSSLSSVNRIINTIGIQGYSCGYLCERRYDDDGRRI